MLYCSYRGIRNYRSAPAEGLSAVPGRLTALGLFIPLIVVNCIILGRAEMFASKNTVLDSALDGLGMGIGFTLALGCMGLIREFLGSGTAFDIPIYANTGIEPWYFHAGSGRIFRVRYSDCCGQLRQ